MRFLLRVLAALAAALAVLPAAAADIVAAAYDPGRDDIVVDIVYRGTNPNHGFSVEWGRCYDVGGPPLGAAARLIDDQGQDVAKREYRVRTRIDLQGLPCRPARVTLRLGRISNAQVLVPAPAR